MRIVVIGAGNVAVHLALALHNAGHQVLQVYSRTEASTSALAVRVGAEAVVSPNQLTLDADLYLMAVKDDAIEPLSAVLPPFKGIVAHTAGSVSLAALAGASTSQRGVFYPLQTFSKEKPLEVDKIPLFVEGSDVEVKAKLHSLAKSLGCTSYDMDSEGRKRMHLAAVFACNFTNHLYALAGDLLDKEGLPFTVLIPLIEESVRKVAEIPPRQAQTGPAIRGDQTVVNTHLAMLDSPTMKEIYRLLSESIAKNG